jgi:hypothetical protein
MCHISMLDLFILSAPIYILHLFMCKGISFELYLQINESSFRIRVILWYLVFFVKVYIIVPHIHKFHANWVDFLVYLRVYLNKLLRAQVITWHVFKGKDVRDYYIEIVKCYLCLALNHQNGVSTWPCGSFEGPVMFANVKENKRFAVQVVRLVLGGVHKHLLSLVVWLWKWGSKGNQRWQGSPATPTTF